jgi:acetyltransferase
MRKHRLDKVFEPKSVAVAGASARPLSVGGQVLGMLIESDFQGELYLVNPKHELIRGLPCYPYVGAIGESVDLVVIAVPAAAVAGIMCQCGTQGDGATIIISAGFG